MKNIGLYIHIPFCSSKCPYCDFYSMRADGGVKQSYVQALLREIKNASKEYSCKADTLYIGGGTPSVLGADSLAEIIKCARESFEITDGEITVECNPHGIENGFFEKLAFVGVSRISLGVQSAVDSERRKLGRRADADEIRKVTSLIKAAGIENISFDVMLGIPDSDMQSLKTTLEFCIENAVTHISGYLLKLEENTPFYKKQAQLNLPDEDAVCDMYLYMCDSLEKAGYEQYEISNFAKRGYESRHNLKYWNCEDYLGIGPSAHSCIGDRRFYYPDSIEEFINNPHTVFESDAGGFSEYAMLRLRLAEGLREDGTIKRYGKNIPNEMREKARKYAENGYLVSDSDGIRLTKKGFLISNTIISELIY